MTRSILLSARDYWLPSFRAGLGRGQLAGALLLCLHPSGNSAETSRATSVPSRPMVAGNPALAGLPGATIASPASHASSPLVASASQSKGGRKRAAREDPIPEFPGPRSTGLLAFPGAEGFGRFALGGRGGRVIFVDNMNDDGPGSFRDAVRQKGSRYILFRVGGTIQAQSEIAVVEPFCTIAGQTAPGDGICVVGSRLVVCTHDVILRGLRFRVGDGPGMPSTGRDNLTIGKRGHATYQVIVDHCSCSWGVDESVSIFGEVRDVTLQWLLNAEALHQSIHLDEIRGPDAHSCGLLIGPGARRVTVHSCLLAHHVYRNPRTGAEELEFVNNLVYNWKSEGAAFSVPADRPMTIAFVGNVYRRGPSTALRSQDGTDRPWGQFGGSKPGRLYLHNNLTDLPAFLAANADNRRAIRVLDGAQAALAKSLVGAWPFPGSGVTVRTIATVADLDYLLDGVGALVPARDGVDARVVNEYRCGAGRIVDSPAQVGGAPVYRSGRAPEDRDGDGLPDAWEQARGFNPRDPTDAGADVDGNGYPEIDDYLNSFFPLAAPPRTSLPP